MTTDVKMPESVALAAPYILCPSGGGFADWPVGEWWGQHVCGCARNIVWLEAWDIPSVRRAALTEEGCAYLAHARHGPAVWALVLGVHMLLLGGLLMRTNNYLHMYSRRVPNTL